MAPLVGGNLCKVEVYASCVLETSLEQSWQHARNFGQASWWSSAGQGEFAVKRLGGKAAAEIGCERMFSVGQARLFEELTALDDMEHIVRWALVSHPSTISPFGQASFVNYTSSFHLRAVTMSNQTFGEWRGQFWTEPQYVGHMEAVLQGWYFAGFKGLETCASGLETLDIPATQPAYMPNALNPNYSIPVQPPPNDQATFKSPTEFRHSVEAPVAHAPPPGQDQFINGGMATSLSQAWQAARAAFGGPQVNSLPSRASGSRTGQSSVSGVHPPHQGPPSNTSSIERQMEASPGRHTADIDLESIPSNGHESLPTGPPIGNSLSNHNPANLYHSNLGSIKEGTQMINILPGQGTTMRGEPMDRATSNLSLGQNSSTANSLSSNHSHSSSRAALRNLREKESRSFDGVTTDQVQPTAANRRSWQEQDHGASQTQQRPNSAVSAMKAEAMQKLNLGAGQRPNNRRQQMRKNLRPDWDSMKEVALIDSEDDARLMNGVARNMGIHLKHKTERTSLEEEVEKLQERHKLLHAERQSTEKPYVSPFSANPFAAAQP